MGRTFCWFNSRRMGLDELSRVARFHSILLSFTIYIMVTNGVFSPASTCLYRTSTSPDSNRTKEEGQGQETGTRSQRGTTRVPFIHRQRCKERGRPSPTFVLCPSSVSWQVFSAGQSHKFSSIISSWVVDETQSSVISFPGMAKRCLNRCWTGGGLRQQKKSVTADGHDVPSIKVDSSKLVCPRWVVGTRQSATELALQCKNKCSGCPYQSAKIVWLITPDNECRKWRRVISSPGHLPPLGQLTGHCGFYRLLS